MICSLGYSTITSTVLKFVLKWCDSSLQCSSLTGTWYSLSGQYNPSETCKTSIFNRGCIVTPSICYDKTKYNSQCFCIQLFKKYPTRMHEGWPLIRMWNILLYIFTTCRKCQSMVVNLRMSVCTQHKLNFHFRQMMERLRQWYCIKYNRLGYMYPRQNLSED